MSKKNKIIDIVEQEEKYIELNGNKGMFTLNEVISLFQENGLKVKISLSKNGDSREMNDSDPHKT